MKKVGYVFHPDYLLHTNAGYHPENPQRLKAIDRAIKASGLIEDLIELTPDTANRDDILLNHTERHYELIKKTENIPFGNIDPDTFFCSASFKAALRSVGGAIKAGETVMSSEIDSAFCALRPPGHHAEPNRAMGFCLFNNIAILARWLIKNHNLSRIAILDWDAHHGNGTQKSFYDSNKVHYTSLHLFPFFPGTGRASDVGIDEGEGYNMNFPLIAGSRDKEYIDIIRTEWTKAMDDYKPEILLISNGYDAHSEDPLAYLDVSDQGFHECSIIAKEIAEKHCNGKIISLFEGGYNLEVLEKNIIDHIKVLME